MANSRRKRDRCTCMEGNEGSCAPIRTQTNGWKQTRREICDGVCKETRHLTPKICSKKKPGDLKHRLHGANRPAMWKKAVRNDCKPPLKSMAGRPQRGH
eukprot:1294988-Pleurochrysis_carterae.AAC.1